MYIKAFLRHRNNTPKILTGSVIVLLLVSFTVLTISRIEEAAVSKAEVIFRKKINSGISEIMTGGRYNTDSFIRIEKNSAGELSAVINNVSALNELSEKILNMLYNCSFNTEISAAGIKIPIKLKVSERSDIKTENDIFKLSQGSQFIVKLKLTAEAYIILPLKQDKTNIETDIIIAEALILSKNAA